MIKCEIFFSEDDELSEFEVQQKEWRGDIIVKIANRLFMPKVITPFRLYIDFCDAVNEGRLYNIDPKLILVEKTDKTTIINILLKLVEIGYFSKMRSVDLKEKYAHVFSKFQELKNWVRVY